MTALLFYNNSMIVSTQKKAYESYKIVDELKDRSEDLTEYIRSFVISGDPRYEEAFWQVFNFRNGITIGPDGRKTSINALMNQLGFTNYELQKLKEAQANSDMLVKKEAMAINAVKGTPDDNISKLIKPNESKRDFAIRIINDESYNHYKANVINPINNVIQLVDKRTQIELMHYNIFNFIFILVTFVIVLLLFIRFIFLINNIKLHIERETVIRKIIEIMRSSIDINSVKSEVVKEIGSYLNADRVFFADYDSVKLDFSISKDSEYKSSENIKSYAGNDMAITQGIVGAIKKYPFSGRDLIFSDLDKHIEENDINEPEIEICFRDMGCIAMMLMHINYGESFYGDIAVTFEKKRKISEDDINFVKTLANQAGIAMYQAELYKKSQIHAEREQAIRKIMLDTVSIFDTTEIIKLMIIETGKLLKADRCFFSKFDIKNDAVLPAPEYSEYLSGKEIDPLFSKPITKNETDAFLSGLKQREAVIIEDVNKTDLPEITKKMLIEKFSVKSYLILPVIYKKTLYGALVLHYVKDFRHFTQDEVDVAMAIANQSAIVLHQTELHP